MSSTTAGVTSSTSPRRVITRESRSTVRYASFWRTSVLRRGSISSRAVARRIVPSRWTLPVASTYPRGRVNAYSVLIGVCLPFAHLPLHPLEALVADLQLLERNVVRRGVEGRCGVLDRPALLELVG